MTPERPRDPVAARRMTNEEYVDHLLVDWPPLTEDPLARLAVLLRGASATNNQHAIAVARPEVAVPGRTITP